MPDHPPHTANGTTHPDVRHERSDANVRGIVTFGVIFTLTAILINVGLWYLFTSFNRREDAKNPPLPDVAKERLQFPKEIPQIPAPVLQVNDRLDMKALNERDDALLKGYGWVDQKKGTVRVPIERTLARLADPKTAAALGIKTRPAQKDAP